MLRRLPGRSSAAPCGARVAALAAALPAGARTASSACGFPGLGSPPARTAQRVAAHAVGAAAPAASTASAMPASSAYAGDVFGPQPLTAWLLREEAAGRIDLDLATLVSSIATACKQISALVARAPLIGLTGSAAATNASGDEQKKLDVIANDIFTSAVSNCGRVGICVSEEEEDPVAVDIASGGKYIVAFDPIDGSSNLDACISTGSIFGIYSPGECAVSEDDGPETVMQACLTNTRRAGTELVGAGYCLYSCSTVLVLTLGDGVHAFTLDRRVGEFVLSDSHMKIPDPGQRIYSGNEGNTALWDADLRDYLGELKGAPGGGKPHSYRYIGALVGDFHRTLCYGGIWLYPPDAKAPSGKARLLYEVAPMSLLAEQAGGLACVGPRADERVLDVVPSSVHEKSPLFVGSASEVRRLQDFLAARKGR